MKKIVLSVMAVVLAPVGGRVADRFIPVTASDPLTPDAGAAPGAVPRAQGHATARVCGTRAHLPVDASVRLVSAPHARVH
ncbi:MAG TPA: hypothetical protein VM011_00600 [Gammaproteobacteria bacterium]|nr:hypothetical protein [Gammaproteobacteria bacterium]